MKQRKRSRAQLIGDAAGGGSSRPIIKPRLLLQTGDQTAPSPLPLATPAPGLSDCGISFSTAPPLAFPAPSDDTAAGGAGGRDITSTLPAAARLFLSPLRTQQKQHQPGPSAAAAADPDEEVSCRYTPCQPTTTARPTSHLSPAHATCAPSPLPPLQQQPELSTASLASWLLPGKAAAAGPVTAADGGNDSDCEDDAVSKVPAAAAGAAGAAEAHHTSSAGRASSIALTTLALPSVAPAATAAAAGLPACGSDDDDGSDGGVSAAANNPLLPMLLELAQGGGLSSTQVLPAGRVMYQTRLEELLFGMAYAAPPTADSPDGTEE